jgi:hypothetical protein
MTAAQQALDDAIKRCKFLQVLLRKKTTKQVWAKDERSTIKATCLAWFTAVRLKVEENQLVGVFGEIGVRVDGLKSA